MVRTRRHVNGMESFNRPMFEFYDKIIQVEGTYQSKIFAASFHFDWPI